MGPVPYIVAGCMFMENLDATVIVTALPTMARDFGAETAALGLGVGAYMLAAAIVLPLGGWLAERAGTRTVMGAAILLFALTSLWCATVNGVPAFVAARLGQGAAAALMVPVGRLVVLRNTPREQLVHAIAILTWPALIAPVLGPPLGGFLTSYASWRWIFLLNLPVAAIGLALTFAFVPQQRRETPIRFDWAGYALVATTMGAVIAGFEMAGAGNPAAAALLAIGLASAWLAARHLQRAPHGLFSLGPVRVPTFAATSLSGGALMRVAIGATPFLLPIMFQTVLGLSAFEAGAYMLVYFVGNLAMKLVTTRMLRRFGFHNILRCNGTIVAASIAVFALGGSMPMMVLSALLLVAGAARSMQFTALNTLTFADVPQAMTSDANTINGLANQLAMTAGVVGASLILKLGSHGGALDSGDFSAAFVAAGIAAALSQFFYARLPSDAGRNVSGHQAAA